MSADTPFSETDGYGAPDPGYNDLEARIRRSEEKAARNAASMRAVLAFNRRLEEAPLEGIYEFVAEGAKTIYGVAVAAVASFDETRSEIVAEHLAWSEEQAGKVRAIIARRVEGMAAPVDEETKRRMLELSVGSATSLTEFSFGAIPPAIGNALAAALGIAWFRGMVLASQGQLFGGIALAGAKGTEPPSEAGLAVFAEMVATSLKRKEAELRVASLLREKELLLKEIHHRVKNHFSTAISILSLQARSCESREAAIALGDAQGRLQAMNTLYDKLYRSVDLRGMSLRVYLPALVEDIVGLFPERPGLEVSVVCDDVSLPAKPLSIVGLIVNELVTNSMKYAFPGDGVGSIEVEARERGGRVALRVSDDGVGLPEGFDPGLSTGFGMGLVRILAEQLEGAVSIATGRGGGASFEVVFDRRAKG